MGLPVLEAWDETRAALHQIALVVSTIRVARSDPLPNDLQFSLDLTAGGVSTTRMSGGGVLLFSFEDLQLAYILEESSVFSVPVAGHSQISLLRRLLELFAECDICLQPSMKYITSETVFAIDRAQVTSYASTSEAVFTALARFRAKLSGRMTPLVLWPHHFDLAFIWFATEGADEQEDPQIAYGFAPYSPGLERPYIYAYAWSQPTGYLDLPLEAPAQAISGAYRGLYAPYDALREASRFDAVVETMLMKYQSMAAALLHV